MICKSTIFTDDDVKDSLLTLEKLTRDQFKLRKEEDDWIRFIPFMIISSKHVSDSDGNHHFTYVHDDDQTDVDDDYGEDDDDLTDDRHFDPEC